MSSTPEAVEVLVGPTKLEGKAPTPEQCIKNLHLILDECDNDKTSNRIDWKAGGEVDVDEWTYRITTKEACPPAPKQPSAWCSLETPIRSWDVPRGSGAQAG
jgi:hypothetical protein